MTDYHNRAHWSDFLAEFSQRNHFRRARFEQFDMRGVQEEEQEAHLETITVELNGPDAPSLIIRRLDNSGEMPREIVTTVHHVKRIAPQYDTDNSEDGLRIEDTHGGLTILRLESLVDGAS